MLMLQNFTETYVSLIKLPRRKQTGVGGRYNSNSRKRTLSVKILEMIPGESKQIMRKDVLQSRGKGAP